MNEFWWALVGSPDGRFVIIGPYHSEGELQANVTEKAPDSKFEAFELPTRDDARAARMIKANRRFIEFTSRFSHSVEPETSPKRKWWRK